MSADSEHLTLPVIAGEQEVAHAALVDGSVTISAGELSGALEGLDQAALITIGAGRLALARSDVTFASGLCVFSPTKHCLFVEGRRVDFRTRQLHMLDYLCQFVDQPVPASAIQDSVWGQDYQHSGVTNLFGTNMARLRQDLETAYPGLGSAHTGVIETVKPRLRSEAKYRLLVEWPQPELSTEIS